MYAISVPTHAHQATPNPCGAQSTNATLSSLRLVIAWPHLHTAKICPNPLRSWGECACLISTESFDTRAPLREETHNFISGRFLGESAKVGPVIRFVWAQLFACHIAICRFFNIDASLKRNPSPTFAPLVDGLECHAN